MRERTVGHDSLIGPGRTFGCFRGGVRERPNRHAWKACVGQLTVGSNPTPSARLVRLEPNREGPGSIDQGLFVGRPSWTGIGRDRISGDLWSHHQRRLAVSGHERFEGLVVLPAHYFTG